MSDLKSIAQAVQSAKTTGTEEEMEKVLAEINKDATHEDDSEKYAMDESFDISSDQTFSIPQNGDEDALESDEMEADTDDTDAPDVEENDADEECVIAGLGTVSGEEVTLDEIESAGGAFEVTEEELQEGLAALDNESYTAVSAEIRQQLAVYRKSLVLKSGFTEEEANEAAHARLKKLMGEAVEDHLTKHPKVGVVEIKKGDEDKLGLTKEEHEKLAKVKVVKLKVVEEADLKEIKIKKLDKKHKTKYLQTMDSPLSKFDVPLPLTADFMTFRGAQIMQLMTALGSEEDGPAEITTKQANLLYDRLWTGVNYQKYGEKSEVKMTFELFTNIYKYHDIELGMYAVLVASSMNDIETTLTCGQCEGEFKYKYNLSSLLNLNDIKDKFKEKFNRVLQNKTSKIGLEKLREENDTVYRVQSPYTHNVYDINTPSIARALSIFNKVDMSDEVMLYLSAIALFIQTILVYDPKDGEYISIEENEYGELFDILQSIPQEDIDLLTEYLKDKFYSPKFILKSTCPHCKNEMTNEFKVSELVFLKAQDSQTETEL